MENNVTNPLTQSFETAACGRCGGSGHYSYCQMHGTVCFGCRGKGKVYTKRAEAALAYARTLRTIKAQDVKVGMLLFVDGSGPFGGKTGWFTVTKSELSNSVCISNGVEYRHWDLDTNESGLGTFAESDVQAVENKARLIEVRALALAFQATLAPNGKVAKVYTPEQQAKRDAAQAKRAATLAAKNAAAQAAREAAQAAANAAAAEAQAKADAAAAAREAARAAERAKSQHVGTVGERREFTITVEHCIHFEAFAYGWAPSTLYLCRDEQGNRIVYKGAGDFLGRGETGTVTATVKDHAEYKGENQTVLSRPKVARPAEAAVEVGA